MKLFVLPLALLCVIGCAYAESNPSFQGEPESSLVRALVRNPHSDAFSPLKINASSTSGIANHSEMLWWRVLPQTLLPGGIAEVRTKPLYGSLRSLRLESSNSRTIDVSTLPAPGMTIQAVKYDSAEGVLNIFWSSCDGKPKKLTSIILDDTLSASSVFPEGNDGQPNELRCVGVKLNTKLHVGSFHHLFLKSDRGDVAEAIFRVSPPFSLQFDQANSGIFRAKSILRKEDGLADLESPIRWFATCGIQPGDSRPGAWALLRRQRDLWRIDPNCMMAISFCPFHQEEGIRLFSGLADAMVVNPYPFALPKSRQNDIEKPMSILISARSELQTELMYMLLEVNDANASRIFPQTLMAFASGCSGVIYRVNDLKSEQLMNARRESIQLQLHVLKSTLSRWSASESLGKVETDTASVQGWLRQLAPRRLAVVLIDSSSNESESRPVQISVNLPREMLPERFAGIRGSDLLNIKIEEGKFTFTVDDFNGGDVIYIELIKKGEQSNGF